MANSNWDTEHDHVARLAYQYWEQRGCSHGQHHDDWSRAEAEILGQRGERVASRTVVGIFKTMDDGRKAVEALLKDGFSRDAISFVANGQGMPVPSSGDQAGEVAVDTGLGAAIGGVGGFLLGFAAFAVPGIGPVLGAGPIMAAMGGAGMGAVAGSLVGVMGEHGIPEEDAKTYAEGVRRGNVLVSVHASGDRANRAAEVMDGHNAVNINDRVTAWRKRGWVDYDSNAAPLSEAELKREQDYYRQADKQAKEWKMEAMSANAGPRFTRVYERI